LLLRDGILALAGEGVELDEFCRGDYNAAGDLVEQRDPLGNSRLIAPDAAGRPVGFTDALGFSSSTEYTPVDQPAASVDPLGGRTGFAYDAAGRLASVTDARGTVLERYGYDVMDRLLTRTDALGKEERYAYNAGGQLTRRTDRQGRLTTYGYDGSGRLIRIEHPEGTVQQRSYDLLGRLERLAEGDFVEEYAYDAADRLTRVRTLQAGSTTTLEYGYDALDRLIWRSLDGQERTDYGYDLAGRLTQVRARGQSTTYSWDGAGRLTTKVLPNGISAAYTWDAADRLTALTYRRGDASVVEQLSYAYDAAGQRIEKTRASGASVPETPFVASYDAANRMTQITLEPNTPQAKTYDLSYDASGALIRKQNRDNAADATTYGWDTRGRLVSLSGPGLEASFKYDPLGRRSERRVNGQSTRYVYDGAQAIGEIREGQSTTLLTSLSIDEMLARYSAQGARSFLTDALGSVIALTREDQSVLTSYAYSPYGQSQTSGAEEGNASQYTARENDGTGLYYYRARYYDAVLRRFVSEDPIGLEGGINEYGYVEGNPVLKRDPLGLESWGPFGPEPGVVFPPSTPNPDPQGEYFRKPAELWDALKKDCMARCVYKAVVPDSVADWVLAGAGHVPKVMDGIDGYVSKRSAAAIANDVVGTAASKVASVVSTVNAFDKVWTGIEFLMCIEKCKTCSQP
jgi:RHS repeat-associated protein